MLLLEAGGPTQHSLGGKGDVLHVVQLFLNPRESNIAVIIKILRAGTDYFGPPLTQFDIPLFWSGVAQYPEYRWQVSKGKQ